MSYWKDKEKHIEHMRKISNLGYKSNFKKGDKYTREQAKKGMQAMIKKVSKYAK